MRKLAKIRATKGFTREEMAEKLGISIIAYNSYEYGARSGTVKGWLKIEEILKTPIKELYADMTAEEREEWKQERKEMKNNDE